MLFCSERFTEDERVSSTQVGNSCRVQSLSYFTRKQFKSPLKYQNKSIFLLNIFNKAPLRTIWHRLMVLSIKNLLTAEDCKLHWHFASISGDQNILRESHETDNPFSGNVSPVVRLLLSCSHFIRNILQVQNQASEDQSKCSGTNSQEIFASSLITFNTCQSENYSAWPHSCSVN